MEWFTNNFYLNFLTTVFILIVTVIFLERYCYSYWTKRGVDSATPSFIFGNASKIILRKESIGVNIGHFCNEFKKKGKQFFGYYFFIRPIFVPIDLDLIKRMNITDFDHFTDHIGHVDENDPLTLHLFNLKGDRWKVLRTKLTPSFTSGKMRVMFSTLLACTNNLKALVEKQTELKIPVDIKHASEKFTSDVIVSCVFGLETDSQQNSEFYKLQKKFMASSFIQSILVLFMLVLPEFYTLFKMKSFDKNMTDFFLNLVKGTVRYREENNVIRKDLMHFLLQIKNNVKISDNELGGLKNEKSDDEGVSLSINEMAAQCFVFYFAGYETSATTINFALFELALNQNIQIKLRDEINTVTKKYDDEITYDAVMEMQYLNKCVLETLRKYPPLQINTRVCTKTYQIPETNVVINKGMHVLLPIYGVHHDPEYYPDPEKFDPERFSEENAKNRHPFAFMPFGGGLRMCIGYKFGIMQVKLALIVLLKHFKFVLHPDTKIPLWFNPTTFVPNPKPPIKLVTEKVIY